MSSTTRSRPSPFGIGSSSSNNAPNKGFASGFGNGGGAWNADIWSGKAIGSGMRSNGQDSSRSPSQSSYHPRGSQCCIDCGPDDLQSSSTYSGTATGSGSLLHASESDGFNLRQGPWRATDETSPTLSRVHTGTSATSHIRRQNSSQHMSNLHPDSTPTNSTYFGVTPGPSTISSRSSQKNFLEPTTGNYGSGGYNSNTISRNSRHNSDEENSFVARKLAFEGTEIGVGMQSARPSFTSSVSGYNSSAASRSGSMPPSRSDIETSTPHLGDMQNSQHSRLNPPALYMPNLSAQASSYNMSSRAPGHGPRQTDQLSPSQMNQITGDFNHLSVGKENQQTSYSNHDPSPNFSSEFPPEFISGSGERCNREENDYWTQQGQFSPTGSGSGVLMSNSVARGGVGLNGHYPRPPNGNNARVGHHSSYYPSSGTSSVYQQRGSSRAGFNGNFAIGQAATLDVKLRGIQQEQRAYLDSRPTPGHFNTQFPASSAYDFQSQPGLRMNQLNSYYHHMPPVNHPISAPHIPRGPANDHAAVQPVRSALLDEFRNNSKTNKRYELKDIYHYIVEFSGDQHGSRFIQQKLETANSDEKDQVFRELHPNAIQLMTDVFGNYVIQKFFEHGNQSQKKILANQMKSHIVALSTQMYGCRVVQKALEHILTDQQAQLIKELEGKVIQCVKDQNGNHVVQKAIERVPAEHIQFILNAFTGQVRDLATHSYGCRVIQRMLEHCEEPTQSAVLQEIHASASSLILDQFGNYVAQHIIEHGRQEDRVKLINLVITQLANFSKHKFASNVVEKSIQHGSKEERDQIVATLTVLNDKGESPSQSLIRDQYGNYVIQKLLNELQGTDRENFVELLRAQLALIKRYSYGKQVAAIEKLIYIAPYPPHQMNDTAILPPAIDTSAAPTPPLLTNAGQSPQSSSLPSTHASSYDGNNDSRKSSGSNVVGVMTPTST
ncbi:mRNA binding protein puf3 [Lecanora helva]